jgi:hypothetical protein
MKKLVLLVATASAALALVRRRQRQHTLKGRLLDLTAKVRSKL